MLDVHEKYLVPKSENSSDFLEHSFLSILSGSGRMSANPLYGSFVR